MSIDPFRKYANGLSSPAREAFAIVPHDTAELARLPKALMVGGSGTIALRAVDSPADVALVVQAGQIVPIRAQFVRSAGTSATGLVGLA
ncbi:MAG: hypothetical protein B7Z08_00210 [Sphingomonadales bacterium 32-68-7]|nr:MAG: hypothetical protein B7Z33_09355 [Sphingomonadales bacterium 12-68-11]OYX10559.1 MAG: hypothetical protein B7Z08_00210 [Sphingomonadales bacterium 32-68-7]